MSLLGIEFSPSITFLLHFFATGYSPFFPSDCHPPTAFLPLPHPLTVVLLHRVTQITSNICRKVRAFVNKFLSLFPVTLMSSSEEVVSTAQLARVYNCPSHSSNHQNPESMTYQKYLVTYISNFHKRISS